MKAMTDSTMEWDYQLVEALVKDGKTKEEAWAILESPEFKEMNLGEHVEIEVDFDTMTARILTRSELRAYNRALIASVQASK